MIFVSVYYCIRKVMFLLVYCCVSVHHCILNVIFVTVRHCILNMKFFLSPLLHSKCNVCPCLCLSIQTQYSNHDVCPCVLIAMFVHTVLPAPRTTPI
jgi:hypothetical protein